MFFHFSRLIRSAVIVFSIACLIGTPGFAEESGKVKDATGEIKDVTKEVKKEDKKEEQKQGQEINIEIKNESKGENEKAAKTSSTGDTSIDEFTNNNHGFQLLIINSDVTINGGTIHGEVVNETNNNYASKEKEAETSDDKGGGGQQGGGQQQNGRPAQRGDEKEKPSPYDELIKDATKEEGLFTVYTLPDKVLWEIPESVMEKNFLMKGILATGVGAYMAKPGALLDGTEDPNSLNSGTIIYFKPLQSDKLQIIQRNHRFHVPPGSPEQSGLEKNYRDSKVATLPVSATNPATGGYLIEINKFLLTDFFQVSQLISGSMGNGYGLDQGNSYIADSNVLPENIVTRVHYEFRSGAVTGNMAVPDSRSIDAEILVHIFPLKDNPKYKTRIADYRIGHWIEASVNFGNDEEITSFQRLITRWDIRKASPELDMSPPAKPTVFWIEKTVPEEYRDAVKEGVLMWNKAFEKIGIKDAFQVKIQPDDADWDVADIRYNTIHWNVSHSLSYSAIAQWLADPRTGEILAGSFLFESEAVRSVNNIRRYQEPDRIAMLKERLEQRLEPHKHPRSPHQCDYAQFALDQAIFGMTILAAQKGAEGVSDEEAHEIITQYITHVTAHEMGHVIGLRHNFEASTHIPLDKLNDKEYAEEHGLTSSVMDYTPMNIAPEGVEQGYYYSPTIGPYDYLAIEYAYTDIKPATGETEADVLNRIAEKAETQELAYSTDDDRYFGLDPMVNAGDLSSDPLAYAQERTKVIKGIIPKLPDLIKEGDDYSLVRSSLNRMLGFYFENTVFALNYIGGQYVTRTKKGGEFEAMPLDPVSAAKQREALNFIIDNIFSDEIFEFDPKLLNMIAGQSWLHWGISWPTQSPEYPIYSQVVSVYDLVLYWLYSPLTIEHILDAEKQVDPKAVTFTVPELFDTVENGIWDEIKWVSSDKTYTNKEPFISTYRRSLQRLHLKRMIETVLQPSFGLPEDARTLAWRSLQNIEDRLDDTLDKIDDDEIAVDEYSLNHLEESLAKVKRALNAQVNARVDLW